MAGHSTAVHVLIYWTESEASRLPPVGGEHSRQSSPAYHVAPFYTVESVPSQLNATQKNQRVEGLAGEGRIQGFFLQRYRKVALYLQINRTFSFVVKQVRPR